MLCCIKATYVFATLLYLRHKPPPSSHSPVLASGHHALHLEVFSWILPQLSFSFYSGLCSNLLSELTFLATLPKTASSVCFLPNSFTPYLPIFFLIATIKTWSSTDSLSHWLHENKELVCYIHLSEQCLSYQRCSKYKKGAVYVCVCIYIKPLLNECRREVENQKI